MKTIPFVLLLSLMSVCFTACNIYEESPDSVPGILWFPPLHGSLIADRSVTLQWKGYQPTYGILYTKSIMMHYIEPHRFEIYQSDQPYDGFTKIAEIKNENKDVSFKVNNLQNGKTVYFLVKSLRKGYETMDSGGYAFIPNPRPKSEIVLTSEQFSGEVFSLSISPTGEKVASIVYDGLYVCNADGTDRQLVTNEVDGYPSPFWNQDGSMLYFTTGYYSQPKQLNSYNCITGEITPVMNLYTDYFPYNFAISPDGNKVLYNQNSNGNMDLYLYNVETGKDSLLMNQEMIDRSTYTEPIWIDNEHYMVKKIQVSSPTTNNISLSLVSYKDNKVEDLIPEYTYFNNYAALSPDKKHIVYMDINHRARLMLYNMENKSLRQLSGYEPDTYIDHTYRHLVWKDNQTVYYVEHSGADGRSLRIVSVSIP